MTKVERQTGRVLESTLGQKIVVIDKRVMAIFISKELGQNIQVIPIVSNDRRKHVAEKPS